MSEPTFISTQVTRARYFYLNLNPSPDASLSVVCGGCEQSLPGYHISRQNFRFYSVEFVAGGRGTITFDAGEVPLSQGMLFTYGPDVPHEIRSDPDTPLLKYFVDFTGSGSAELLDSVGLPPGSTARTAVPQRICDLCENLLESAADQTPYRPRICTTLLELLLLTSAETRAVGDGDGHSSRAASTYLRCRLYIQEHVADLHTLDDIARHCHIDRAYLCRLFQRFDGRPPYQFLIRLKMNRAAERLAHEDRLVKEVAAELGYADPYHFSRVFKRVIGVSPREFIDLSRRGTNLPGSGSPS